MLVNIEALRKRLIEQKFDQMHWFGKEYSFKEVKSDMNLALDELEEFRKKYPNG